MSEQPTPKATTATAARVFDSKSSHWYTSLGEPCYELPKANGKGTKSPTLADARKLGLLPSVTTILKALAKPELQSWIIEQSVLAVLTTPRRPGETEDAFVHRVLHEQAEQEQERQKAADLGTRIHDALADALMGQTVKDDIWPYIAGVVPILAARLGHNGQIWSEVPFAFGHYGGRIDMVMYADGSVMVYDFKTTKTIPDKQPWKEHRLQLAAYSAAIENRFATLYPVSQLKVSCANVYISTIEPGKWAIYEIPDWASIYQFAWDPLVMLWQWLNQYYVPEAVLAAFPFEFGRLSEPKKDETN